MEFPSIAEVTKIYSACVGLHDRMKYINVEEPLLRNYGSSIRALVLGLEETQSFEPWREFFSLLKRHQYLLAFSPYCTKKVSYI